MSEEEKHDVWAIAHLFGHVVLAGKVTPGELWQINIPLGDDKFCTEFFSPKAVFRIQVVSEEIARAYAANMGHEVLEYAEPIVLRDDYENMRQAMMAENLRLRRKVEELAHRLTAVAELPAGEE